MFVDETITYLEMKSPDELVAGKQPPSHVEIKRQYVDSLNRVRKTYEGIGKPLYWLARPEWPESEWRDLLGKENLYSLLIYVEGNIAGMIELKAEGEGSTELSVFGLLPIYIGKGYGGYALTLAIEKAWDIEQPDGSSTRRVWVNTSTMDHRHAITNYKARGFVPYKTEDKQREIPDDPQITDIDN
ncbi:MAG TPA: GNAT family N-acetyltransferase [Acidimicrobiia bacterium]|nr:GNAT family N-acetyltransferase [Acidimicrobiia bacterium]